VRRFAPADTKYANQDSASGYETIGISSRQSVAQLIAALELPPKNRSAPLKDATHCWVVLLISQSDFVSRECYFLA
jgi:hypothetical protein